MKAAFFDGIRSVRFSRSASVLAALTGMWLSLGTGSALAAGEPHPFLFKFDRSGTAGTQAISNPNGIAIDESTGDVYVAALGSDAIYKFDANGDPIDFFALGGDELTGLHTPAGSFAFVAGAEDTPAALAVDNSTEPSDPSRGDIYVMDAGHGVIDKFSPSGEYLNQITGFPIGTGSSEGELRGLAVNAAGTVEAELSPTKTTLSIGVFHEVLIKDFGDSAVNDLLRERVNTHWDGIFGMPESIAEALGLAVGPTGDDYLLDGSCPSCVVKFGQHLAPLGQVDSQGGGDVALATDRASGHLYVDDQTSVAEWDTGAMNGGPEPPESGYGTLIARFGEAQLSGSSPQGGIAVNGADGRIYVSHPADGKVYVFGSEAPAVNVAAATDINKESVTLNGTVDPRGVPITSCEFQYGVAEEFGRGPYEHSVSCMPPAGEIGGGTTPVAVSATVTEGLKPGLLYRFHIVAGNSSSSTESAGLFATAGLPFGLQSFEVQFLNQDGTPDTQAGSHPYEMLTNIAFNSRFGRVESNADSVYARDPVGTLKNLSVDLPPGLVGDPNATSKKCTLVELLDYGEVRPTAEPCTEESQVGSLSLFWSPAFYYGGERITQFNQKVYSVVPPRGVALQLGVNFINPDLFINNGLLAGGDYPIQATIVNAPATAPVVRSLLTVFGVVGSGVNRKPFLTLPTGCNGPLRSSIHIESYQGETAEAKTVSHNSAGTPVSLTGCAKLMFPPEISAAPDTTDASTSSGLTVHVKVPQTAALNPDGLAESSLRDTTVTLPKGVTLNPAGADGLEACTSHSGALPLNALGDPTALGTAGDQIGYLGKKELNSYEPGVNWDTFTPEIPSPLNPGVNFCPDGSKIGTVKIKTPLLEHELEGAVYLAAQGDNPFGSLVAMYMVAEDAYSGSLIKLAGEVSLSPTGQIVTTFKNTPDLPFEDLELHFFGGERAPLSTPSRCGTYTTKAVFTPWDGNGPVTSESSFKIEHGPNGGRCPGVGLPFDPSLTAGTTSNQAGGLTPFTMTMSREDGQQNLQAISLKMPPGLSGLLTGVELCGEAQANAGLCGPNSLIGETIVSVGVGNAPFTVTGGKVYLTGPYKGAPFGLSIVNPAKAGPFDLENTSAQHPACDCLVVRAKIEVDPITADLTVTSDNEGPYKIPTIIEGIPLQIKHVNVTINRPSFTFNPTNCSPLSINGELHSTEGGSDAISVPFQATNCARLSFKPSFEVSTSGKTSRADGASLRVKLVYPKLPFGSQANIASVKVDLPKQLPSNLEALKHACIDTIFDANPAACPAESRVGSAMATTPLIPVALTGPAYFVSHGSAKFPELIVVLQGYGVTVDLHGETFIKNGITSSTFHTIPDVPVGTFELNLPQRPKYAALAAPGGLCSITKSMLVKRKVKVRSKNGKTHTVTRKVKQTAAAGLTMPTAFTAQNGATIHQNTPISVTGCGTKAKKAGTRKPHKKK